MPGPGQTIIVGGGISDGSPFELDHFLKVSAVSPPFANSSSRLIERATSIEILGDGALSTAIGFNADANGAGTVAIGSGVSTAQANSLAVGENITLGNTGQCFVGSISSAAGTYNLASAFTGLGMQHSYTLFPSNSVMIGQAIAGGGNSAVAVGASAAITGNGSVAIGANAQAALNSTCIGQLATSGTGGSTSNISIGNTATGPVATNGVILIGNRGGAGGTVTAGDIILGHQDNNNSVFSLQLLLGGPDHRANTVVPAFNIRGRRASGVDINAGDLTIVPQRATGAAAGGGVAIQATTPGAAGAAIQAVATALRVDPFGNITLCAPAGSYGAGVGVVFLADATTAPTVNPAGGGILYSVAGALTWRGSGGTTTVIAPA